MKRLEMKILKSATVRYFLNNDEAFNNDLKVESATLRKKWLDIRGRIKYDRWKGQNGGMVRCRGLGIPGNRTHRPVEWHRVGKPDGTIRMGRGVPVK